MKVETKMECIAGCENINAVLNSSSMVSGWGRFELKDDRSEPGDILYILTCLGVKITQLRYPEIIMDYMLSCHAC